MALPTPEFILKNPLFIARLLGYDKVNSPTHEDWIKSLWKKGNDSIQAHRNSYKTTCSVISIIWGLLFKPNTTILLNRKAHAESVGILSEIMQHYEKPPLRTLYQEVFGIKEPRDLSKWSVEKMSLSTKTTVTKERNIEVSGVGKHPTGQHYDLIVADDIITLKDRMYLRERENTKQYVKELENVLKADGIGIKYRGTPWHKDDAWQLLPLPKKYPISLNFIPALTPDRLEKIRSTIGPSLYAANYELKHIASETALFSDPQILPFPSDLQTIAVLDPAYSGRNNTALAIGGVKGETIYATGYSWPDHVTTCYDRILEALTKWRAGTLYIESNADKGFSARDLEKLRGRGTVEPYPESENKHIRIIANVKSQWANIYFHPDTQDIFLNNVIDYQEGVEPDDEADALAGLIRKFIQKKIIVRGGSLL